MKHTEVPNEISNLQSQELLEHGDKIIYAAIRRYMNKETRDCFPALTTISTTLKCSKTKVLNAISRLIEVGLIEKHTDGRKNHYYFPQSEFDKKFEMFTDDFIDMDLPLNVKEYYMDIQPFLCGKGTGVGKCAFSNAEISRRTGWTCPSIKKYNTYLIEHNLLEEEVTDRYDEAGLPVIQKNFNLTGLNQAALWVRAVTEQIVTNTEDIEELKKKVAVLERELSIRRNATYPEKTYPL